MPNYSYSEYRELKKEILAWLPKQMVNAHIHCGTKIKPRKNGGAHKLPTQKNIIKKGLFYDRELQEKIYFQKKIKFVGFPFPFLIGGIEAPYVNRLMISEMQNGVIGCLLASQKISEMESAFSEAEKAGVRFHGLKMHIKAFKKYPSPTDSLADYFNDAILKFCKKNDLTIIYELNNGFQKKELPVLEKINNFGLNLVIPHFGMNFLGFVLPEKKYLRYQNADFTAFENKINKIKKLKNIYLDSSLIIDQRIINAAFAVLGEDRIIWGDDFPSSLSPKIKEWRPDNKDLEKILYHIIIDRDQSAIWPYILNIYLQIKGIKNYFDQNKKNVSKQFKNKIFKKNAEKIFKI